MKPLFAVLKANHMGHQVVAPQVYDAIGHPQLALEPAWANTCAIRMSIALIAAGMKIRTGPARLWIKIGPHKGEQVEPSQRVLSDFVAKEIGPPEKYKSAISVFPPLNYVVLGYKSGRFAFFLPFACYQMA